ncbi:DNA-directed RNA polymerase subunit K [Candidatus Woesearchaeota archaeon]|nr:DNA-directed RNA polymerase subunit K [Candidatus Woesearchaeota archaeon]
MTARKYTKYERARLIGARALQLAMGAPMLLNLKKAELESLKYSPVAISKMEFEKGVLPITIKRPLPEKVVKE